MAQFINIQADIDKAQAALSGTAKSLKSIQKQTLGTVARAVVKQIKSVIRATTKKQSGWLSNAYKYKLKKSGESVSIFPSARNLADTRGSNLALAKTSVLSYGRTIEPKNKKYLTFQVKGQWLKMKSITISPRGFVQAGEQYANSNSYMGEVEKVIDKELAKYWGK